MNKFCKMFAALAMPVYYDKEDRETKDNPHYDLPDELRDLFPAERMVISQLSVYIPVVHFKKGQNGVRGHVCCFSQDFAYLCNELPRLPKDCNIVHIVKQYKESNNLLSSHMFRIRKKKVLDALVWLKEHNRYYADIKINVRNLDWMKGEEEADLSSECSVSTLCNEHLADISDDSGDEDSNRPSV